ncbi:selenium-dependent molybdenum cofactor biosynthesis protein YqeB [uncultured Cetobacterium sp.]|uniref:selenium-dependent molybdenum cofactor biosynthesis protein YqeB n=1 Tax=uncultured Cetobacterium sp. TaxID=527638 RepID=UPI00262E8192|nr:selenium-dependent molybdenum cofactor biosynthesis protein YqeB [uncultured Cetobacterium sp.]
MLVIVRGGGDIATGIIHRLFISGFKILVLETENPSAIRRTVSFSECIYRGRQEVEGVVARKIMSIEEANECWEKFEIPIIVDSEGRYIEKLKPNILIDSILAKKNLGTTLNMAPITIGLGPGFEAGKDVDLVIETMRGHNLGKVISEGKASQNTGIPGEIAGFSKERVIYSSNEGFFTGYKKIGDFVEINQIIGDIDGYPVKATITGLLRGVISDGYFVKKTLKIADIDPRGTEYENCFTISDKARTLGGAVLESILKKTIEVERKNGLMYFRKNFTIG